MSQLPKYGGQNSKNVKTTTTRTMRVPGTNSTVTRSKTVITEVTTCSTASQTSITRAPARAETSRLRQPSGLRAPSAGSAAAQQSTLHPDTCGPTPCNASQKPPVRSPGVPQVRLQGLPRPASQRTAAAASVTTTQTRAQTSMLRQSQASAATSIVKQPQASAAQQQSGLQRPRPTGMQQPAASGLQRPGSAARQVKAAGQPAPAVQRAAPAALPQPQPSGIQCPAAGLQRSTSNLQRPASGLQRPASGLQRPASGLQRPASGLQRPAAGLQRSTSNLQRPASGLQRPASGLQRPTSGLQRLSPTGLRQPTGMAPCAAARMQQSATGASRLAQPQAQRGLRAPAAKGIPKITVSKPPSPSAEERANKTLMERSVSSGGQKVTARAATMSTTSPQYIDTAAGKEQVMKQAIFEKRIERDEEGEKIVKNLQIVDAEGGAPKMIEMNLQQMDPNYALPEGKEIISIQSKISMTQSYTTVTEQMSRAVTEPVAEAANYPPDEIAKLVEEENEDIDNTLKMLPPDMPLSPGRYEMKKRLQHLQMNSESVALLEQSIIHPESRADEAQNEPTPEVMAAMMHTVEKGVPPQSTPDQVFNTLFVETSNERYIKLSPITEGPLQDVVVPTDVPLDVHKEVISDDMEKLTEKLQNIPTAAELPVLDIFDQVMAADKKSPSKGKNKQITFPMISDEKSLWVNANLEHLVNVIGATPVEVLDPVNVDDLETSGTLETQMSAGVEYYLEADPVQYMSRVQLRGTQLPNYFPGYLVALPEFPEVVRIANTPDEVFASAWKAVQPKYFPDESLQSSIY